jgi:hypothetical protein
LGDAFENMLPKDCPAYTDYKGNKLTERAAQMVANIADHTKLGPLSASNSQEKLFE